MAEWFECKVRYEKLMEDGKTKKVTESYLVDALSFTEAEKRFLDEITPSMRSDFMVSDIKRTKITEICESTDPLDDRWFKARIAYLVVDEDKGLEKRIPQTIVVQAKDFVTSLSNLQSYMAGTLGDWIILNIAESNIFDIFKYSPKNE